MVNAHLGFIVFRLGLTSAVFVLVLAPFGVYASLLGAVGAWLVAVLVGLASGSRSTRTRRVHPTSRRSR